MIHTFVRINNCTDQEDMEFPSKINKEDTQLRRSSINEILF